MRKILVSIFVCLLMLSASYGWAQSVNAGDIRGTVTDPTGAVIPGTTVTVLNIDTGVSIDFTTNGSGVYDTNSIVPGHYTITFTHAGFEQLVRGPVTLEVGFSSVNAQLKLGSDKQQVTVTTDIPLLTTESGEQATVLDSRTMGELPQVTQDWENFIILLPGATGTPGSSAGSSNPGQVAAINGNLPYNNILADGASNTLSHSQNAQPAIFENVAELQVNTSTFSAQYGIGGAIFNQISKGGTSSFHGSAYDYVQNNALDAAPWVPSGGATVPVLHYNNYGGTIGGPVLKKRMFFYFNVDRTHQVGSGSVSTSSVPTDQIQSGDFTGLTDLYDPTTQVMALDSKNNLYPVRQSFTSEYGSNKIPSTMFDKVSAAFQNFYPNSTTHPTGHFVTGDTGNHGQQINNFVSELPNVTPVNKYFGRLDYDVTKNNRITMSDTQQDTPAIYLNAVAACPVGCQAGDVDNNNAQVTDVWSINSHITNEARMGYTWQGNFFADLALGKGYAAKTGWQFAKADDFPDMQFADGDWAYAWIEPSANAVYKEHVFDPSDVVTLITGKHILHFGVEVLAYDDNSTAWGNTNAGTMQFGSPGWGINQNYTAHWSNSANGASIDNNCPTATAATCTGWAYADFLLGTAADWSAGVTPEYGGRLKSPQMFVQDDWKIKPNLTINVGMRYQLTRGWSEVHGNIDNFDPTVTNNATGTLGAMWYASTAANGRKQLQANTYSTFMPRIGFAWQPLNKMTVRGGFGVFAYNMSLDNYGGGMGAPFGQSGNASDTTGFSPIVQADGSGDEITPNGLDGIGIGTTTSTPVPYVSASTDPDRFNGSSVSGNLYHTPVPEIYQWNMSVQREITHNLEVEAAYVASHGRHLSFPMNLNQIPQSELLSTGINTAAIPYPQYGKYSIGWNTLNAVSNYNSLQLQINKRMSNGLNFSFNYVWSHMLDDQDSSGWGSREGPQPIQSAYNVQANYGPSNFDVRNAFKGYVVYKLPFGKGAKYLNNNFVANEIVGGWQISGTVVLSTGNPFMVTSDQHTNANGSGQFPNWSGVSPTPAHKSIHEWFNPGAFLNPGDGNFGNVGRNALYGPGINTFNLSAHKDFILFEGWGHTVNFQLRADAQNAFNHPSFAPPGGTLGGSGGAGTPYTNTGSGANSATITGVTVGGRNIQIGAHLTF